jgi:DNA polymerase
MEEAARAAILTRNKMFQVGKVGIYAREHCLFLVLPSGRAIRYWRPRLESVTRTAQVVDDTGAVVEKEYDTEEIQFFTVGPDKTRMVLESTYGGKLVENVTQAVARDLLAEALLRVEATAPYEIVMHVHDSVATEVPKDKGDVREFCALLTTPPAWAAGCPIAAEGYRSSRFLG